MLLPLKNINTETDPVKKCTICGKSFIRSKGFHKNGKGYRSDCKQCNNERSIEAQVIKKGGNYDNHLYGQEINGVACCKRCGIERRKTAGQKVNQWILEYWNDGMWTMEHPKCISNK